jgi:signal peptidase I
LDIPRKEFAMNESNDNEIIQTTDEADEEKAAEEAAASASETGENPAGESKEEKRKPFADAYDWVSSLIYAVIFMLALNLFVFRSITVDGESMCNTLQDQDKIIATNLFYTPNYGDIVVVQADRLVNSGTQLYGEPIIKRVIALEGDVIRFDFDAGEVYLNGELLDEDYIAAPTHLRQNGWAESGVDYVVPENCVFVMGDNRNRSRDSRDLVSVGFVNKDLIMGKALVRIYPFDSITLL